MQFSSRALSVWARVRPESNCNEGVLCIPQSPSITGTLPSDYLVSYQDTRCGESFLSAEGQSEYSTAPADWTKQ